MKISQSLIASILFIGTSAFAQEAATKDEKRVKPIAPAAFYLSSGYFYQNASFGTLADFQKLAPQSTLLDDDFSGFQTAHGNLVNISTFTSVALGLKFWNKERTGYRNTPELRVGLSYGRSNPVSFYFSKTETSPYDTLSSSQSSAVFYVDSVTRTNYSMSYNCENIVVDLSAIYRTNPLKRWSLYAGLGCAVGGSFNTYTTIMMSDVEHLQTRDENGNTYSETGLAFDFVSERFRNKSNALVWASVPMGVDFRIGKKRELLKHVHLYYEARPGMSMLEIPELNGLTSANMYQSIGIKVSFDNATED